MTGLARLVRSTVTPALENVALWHERDISHSSVERVIAPDATIALDFALARLTGLIDRLVVYPEEMRRNLESSGGLVNSQRVLLALTQAGMSREDAYAAVQRHAMAAWHGEGRFADLLKADPEIARYLVARGDRRPVRYRLSSQARRHDLPPRLRRLNADGTAMLIERSESRVTDRSHIAVDERRPSRRSAM